MYNDASFLYRSSNLFKQLDSRDLTPAEQAVIDQRVALQRRMFQAFEKQETARKVLPLVLLSIPGSARHSAIFDGLALPRTLDLIACLTSYVLYEHIML